MKGKVNRAVARRAKAGLATAQFRFDTPSRFVGTAGSFIATTMICLLYPNCLIMTLKISFQQIQKALNLPVSFLKGAIPPVLG